MELIVLMSNPNSLFEKSKTKFTGLQLFLVALSQRIV